MVIGVGHLVGDQVRLLRKWKDQLKVDVLQFLEAPRETPVLVHSYYTAMIPQPGPFRRLSWLLPEKLLEVIITGWNYEVLWTTSKE